MSRGRKPNSQNNILNWGQFFNKNAGSYLQIISNEPSSYIAKQDETAAELLKKIRIAKQNLVKEKKLRSEGEQTPIQQEEIPYTIPRHWSWVRLGEIGICRTGTTPPTSVKEYFGNDIPFVKPADITLTGLVIDNEGLTYTGLNEGVLIPTNSLLMVCIGGSIGKSYFSQIPVSCNQQINTITPLCGIKARFLQYLLQSNYFQKAIWKKTSGGTTPIINRSKWESIPIPLPPLSEQDNIIDFFQDFENNRLNNTFTYFNSEIERKIISLHESRIKVSKISSELTHQLTLVKKLRQQLLQDAVQGKLVKQNPKDEPASELLKKIKAEKEKLIAEKKIKKEKELPPIKPEEIPFEILENWVWCRLEFIAEIGTGGTPLTSNSEYYANGNIPWITSSATNNLFVEDPELFITEKALKETNCKVYPQGTLVVAMYGQGKTRGQITELNFAAATNQACATISLYLNDLCLRKFLKIYFQKIYLEIRELAQGGAQPNLNMGKIKSTLIPIPPLTEQIRIVQKLDELMQYCNELEASIQQSAKQNEKLLQQVLREALQSDKN